MTKAWDVVDLDRCEFCKLVRRESPASLVYEDETVMAFLDIRPINEGHTLVIPKKHYETIYEVPEEEIAHLYRIAQRIAIAIRKGVKPGGISITQHNERGAGQDVFHVHVHVIPRYEGQRLPRFEEIPEASRERLDEVAERLKQHIQIEGQPHQ